MTAETAALSNQRHLITEGELIDRGTKSTIIVGAGIAGLVSAINLKEAEPDHAVVVVDKPHQQSNTRIAGQRYRHGISGQRIDNPEELLHLLASRNEGIATPEMIQFAQRADQELGYWASQPNFIENHDSKSWFGPQWGATNAKGGGRGASVLAWFTQKALDAGVIFLEANVANLRVVGGAVAGIDCADRSSTFAMRADNYVVANGNAGGYLFHSTNVNIENSGSQLLFKAGIPLVDTTIHMLHPFARTNAEGDALTGCYETDTLDKASVYLDGLSRTPVLDKATTDLLRKHEAHYHFPEIAEKFIAYGGVVKLVFPDNSERLARVSHHYSHMGVETSDGISVSGMENLFVAGDASGTGYWNNHTERFPGFALVKTLVEGRLIAEALPERDGGSDACGGIFVYDKKDADLTVGTGAKNKRAVESCIRSLNTTHLLAWSSCDDAGKDAVAEQWVDDLRSSGYDGDQVELSLDIAQSHVLKRSSNEE